MRSANYTNVRYLGQSGYRLPYPWKVMPTNPAARVVVLDPAGQAHLVPRGSLSR